MQPNHNEQPCYRRKLEDKLIGRRDTFTMEQRVYHVLCLVILLMLVCFLGLNMYLQLFASKVIIVATFISECTLYYLSRFRQQFMASVLINALVSYVVIIALYYLSAGIEGPNLFIFLLTFALLLAITPSRLHPLWILLHGSSVLFLVSYQYTHPEAIPNVYATRLHRYIDIQVTYIIVLVLVYFVMIYMKRHYVEEKGKAEEMTGAVKEQKNVLEKSEAKLRSFFNGSTNCHMILGKNGEILDFNNASKEYMKHHYNTDIAAGMMLHTIVTSSYKKPFFDNYHRALEGAIITEESLLNYGDYAIWWSFCFQPAYMQTGEIIGVSITSSNIHQRKEQEEMLKEQNHVLSRIAFIQSHEMRRPVASILGLMDLIKSEDYQPSKEYLVLLEEATIELDEKIHMIARETNELFKHQ